MSIGYNIRKLRTERGLSQAELGEIAGVTDKAVSTWESDQKTPRMGAIEKMASFFGVRKVDILGWDELGGPPIPEGFVPLPVTEPRPLVGAIACGEPILAEENIEDYIDVPAGKNIDFCLLCRGDSMVDAGICDGDIVYIHQTPHVENGEIAAVLIGNEATLKRFYFSGDTVTLVPASSKYTPITFTGEAINEIHIEGKAVGFTHWL